MGFFSKKPDHEEDINKLAAQWMEYHDALCLISNGPQLAGDPRKREKERVARYIRNWVKKERDWASAKAAFLKDEGVTSANFSFFE